MRHEFAVDFQREEGDDLEFAQANYPDRPRAEQLTAQLCTELDENPAVKGTYTVKAATIEHGAETFTLLFAFDTPEENREAALQLFRAVLQRTYDRYGMAGRFNIQADAPAA
jgi:hypothetical protein